ncbi:MAG: efflux RND transporter periplasmic adaptor subunit [Chitinophagaceae bacterium]|nr:efflux RND transporter periplasmic adaptor subunit [Chitinophagaceae bacterium]
MKKENLLLVMLTLFLALTGCQEDLQPVDMTRTSNTTKNESRYEIGAIVEQPLASYVKLPGQLRPYEEVNIYAKVNGFVKTINVDLGSVVKKNQVLLELEAPEIESQVQVAMSKFTHAQENAAASRDKYRRLLDASKEAGAVAPLDLDNALSKMKADDAVVMSEKSNMEAMSNIKGYLKVTAPFDGVIIQRNVSAGSLVGPGSKADIPLMVLQHLQKLRLEVFIPEAYVDKVDLKRPVRFRYNAMPGMEQTATISRSANALSSMRSEAVEIDINNTEQTLKPGMYAEVKIPLLSSASSLLVPNHAIVRSTEKQYVICVKDGKAHYTDIQVGLTTNDFTEIFGDLHNGDEIILHASDEIREGTTVK